MEDVKGHTAAPVTPSRSLSSAASDTLAIIEVGCERAPLARLAGSSVVPFAGDGRLLDFPVASCLAAGIPRIAFTACANAGPLHAYVARWSAAAAAEHLESMEVWEVRSALTRRCGASLAPRTAALLANAERIAQAPTRAVLLLRGNQVYSADFGQLLDEHFAHGDGVTIGCVAMPLARARGNVVVTLDARGRVLHAAPAFDRRALVTGSTEVLVLTGICAIDPELLIDSLSVDAADSGSEHDFVRDVLPLLIRAGGVRAHLLRARGSTERAYWRDVDPLDGYWHASMELFDDSSRASWPLRPLANGAAARTDGRIERSIVGADCVIDGSVRDSVVSAGCTVEQDAVVVSSVVMPGAHVGIGSVIRNAIVGAGVTVPRDTMIGADSGTGSFDVLPSGVAMIRPATAHSPFA